jgi:hypothetical protein
VTFVVGPKNSRFRLLIGAVPVVLIVLVVRFVAQNIFDIGEVTTFGEIGSVITGVTLILGFMLGGVLADYKESEKIPAVVAGGLAAFGGTTSMALGAKEITFPSAKQRIADVGNVIQKWFFSQVSDEEMWAAHADLARLISDLEREGIPSHYISRLLVLNGDITNNVNRIAVIRNTSFVQSGYVLMWFLVSILQLSLAVVSFPSTIMSWIAPSVLSLAYAYLMLLVRDLDNPFGHGENNGAGSGADVDISPVLNAVAQLNR